MPTPAPGGTFARVQDGGWALRFDSATHSSRGVSLDRRLARRRPRLRRAGLRARPRPARRAGGGTDGERKAVAAPPNTLVPLGPGELPGRAAGGGRPRRRQRHRRPAPGRRRLSLGLDPGSQVLVGLARAALPAAHRHRAARLSWLALGVAGHGVDTGSNDLAAAGPLLLGLPEGRLDRRPGGADRDAVPRRALRLGRRRPARTGFDCSGLAMYVYAQLGIQLTHYTGSQFYEGTRVPPWALRPGDLVFFEPSSRGPQHEGMYIGGGRFIQAPHTGDVVKISSLVEPGVRLRLRRRGQAVRRLRDDEPGIARLAAARDDLLEGRASGAPSMVAPRQLAVTRRSRRFAAVFPLCHDEPMRARTVWSPDAAGAARGGDDRSHGPRPRLRSQRTSATGCSPSAGGLPHGPLRCIAISAARSPSRFSWRRVWPRSVPGAAAVACRGGWPRYPRSVSSFRSTLERLSSTTGSTG